MASSSSSSSPLFLFALVASSLSVSLAQDPEAECITVEGNPFGDCDGCQDQLWMNADCSQVFVCNEDGTGELCECDDDYIMLPDPNTGTYICMDNSALTHRCVGAFHVRCADAPVETPLNSDLCECEGQLWIAPDCKSGFSCRSRVLDGGFFIECDEGEQIDVDLRTWRWGCQPEADSNCPDNKGGLSLGCESGPVRVPTDCYPTIENPHGICECDGQIFMSDDCSQAFQCVDNDIYDGINDGCLYLCEEGEIMLPEFKTGLFMCRDNADDRYECPGHFRIHCDDDPVVDPVSDNECECDGQLWVAPDCKSGFSCDADREGGGFFWGCTEPGEIIDVDVRTWNWGCKPDNGNCPAGGGFSLGCESGPVRVPTEGVAMQENPIEGAVCECAGQVYMDENCHAAFRCSASGDDQSGDFFECDDDELLLPDFGTGTFRCLENLAPDEAPDALCPGRFKTYCEGEDVTLAEESCECEGQMWVSGDCEQGFNCRGRIIGGGLPIECPAGETIHYGGGAINRYECAAGDTQCPGGGGYSLGCRIPFTQATDNTGGDDDDDDAASSVAAVSALMVAAVSFALRV